MPAKASSLGVVVNLGIDFHFCGNDEEKSIWL